MPVQPRRPDQTENLDALQGIIGWFHQSSAELAQEYRRLEERVASLNRELEVKNLELEKSLQEREEARAYLLSILESLNAGVLVLDPDLRPTLVNRRLTELAGEVTQERVIQLTGEKLNRELKRGKKEFLPLESEKIIRGAKGNATPVHLTVSEVATGSQKKGYVLVFQDVSRLKRLEAEAARSSRLASLGVMASEIAHQVRNPLGGIELYASLLKEKTKGQSKQLAGEILNAVQRLNITISDLLSFAADPAISAQPLVVSSLFNDVREICAPLFSESKWALGVEIEPGLPPLWADPALLTQALLNLVINATEATPQGGLVILKAQRAPFATMNGAIHRALEIKVIDSGPGIPPGNRERIFDPFFTTKPEGTGLGLALTQKIVHAHEGTIGITSPMGGGTQFTLVLPVAEEIHEHEEAHCSS